MWISNLISGDLGNYANQGIQFLQGTIEAVERRVSFLQRGQTQVFNLF